MSYEGSWYADKRVVLQRLWGTVTLEEAAQAHHTMVQFLDEGTPLVHVLVDLSQVEQFPTNLIALKRAMPPIEHSGMGWMLVCGAGNPMLRFVASTIIQIMMPGLRLRMFDTLDQSLTFLQDQDSTLENLMALSDTA